MKLLKAEKIFKSYADSKSKLEVLKGVDFDLESGEMIAITGESGCGKSTLLHILGLLDKPDSGSLSFFEKPLDMNENRLAEFRNQKIGFVFQFHYLLEDFNAEENVAMPMFINTGNITKSLRQARQLLLKLGLKDRYLHFPNQMSGGEQQRVAIARSLVNTPVLIFADEPTGNLDPLHSNEIVELMVELNKEMGQSYVIVTHNQEIANRMQRNLLLKNGILNQL